MKRQIEEELFAWKNDPLRMPLLIRGARQVGKSYLVEKFGAEHFESCTVVNFEADGRFASCFDVLDPQKIMAELEIVTGTQIMPGKSLLFLDEIQECPRAITALRYFKEKLPELHVIGAGSLLEFTLHDENFSFPVGRIQFAYLKPLSFREFLVASGERKLLEMISNATLAEPLSEVIHHHALGMLRQYLLVGGMPAVISAFLKTRSYATCQRQQKDLLKAYVSDFGKYAPHAQYRVLQLVFERAPHLVGQHFQYVKVDREVRSRDLKRALEQLCYAGLISRIHTTSANGIPLNAERNEKKFKLLFLDIGLLQSAHRTEIEVVLKEDLLQVNSGSIAEQFVGQELQAYSSFYDERQLYFWERSRKGGSAEVDYVITVNSTIVPIEVKSGKTGRLRSLHQFLKEKNTTLGVRISQHPLSLEGNILSIPLYMLAELPRLLST